MDRSQLLAALSSEAEAFYAAASAGPLDARVPACPDWTLEDLVYHLGEVHHSWGEIAARGLQAPDVNEPPRPPAADLVAWAQDETGQLQRALAAADPAAAVWTWAPQKDVAFIVRRMAQETAVHRWDAESAAGTPSPIGAELAADGIAEFLAFFLDDEGREVEPTGGSVHLHATDTPGEWLVREEGDGSLAVSAEHAKGDAAVRGPASDLLLVLWRRIDLDALEVLGDHAVAARLMARSRLDCICFAGVRCASGGSDVDAPDEPAIID